MTTSEDRIISDEQLNEVEKVFQIVQKLSSSDKEAVQEACQDADNLLKKRERKKGFEKTTINKSDDSKDHRKVNGVSTTDASAFMTAVAQDAEERAKRRAKQRERAEKIKERANAFFKAGDWKRSVELYTQAIEVSKDWDVLYTNRAQAYLRLGQADLALKDCDAAVFLIPNPSANSNDAASEKGDSAVCNSRLAKAHLHRGKALMALNQPSAALEAYSLSRSYSNFKPHLENTETKTQWPPYLAEYAAQAEAALVAQAEDAKAAANFEACAIGPVTNSTEDSQNSLPPRQQVLCLLAQLARANQASSYYAAGLRQLCNLFTSVPKELPVVESKPTAAEQVNHQPVNHESNPTQPKVNGTSRSNKKKRSGAKSKYGKAQPQPNGTMAEVEKPQPPVPAPIPEILADLQTLFRLKSGFSLLDKEVVCILRIFGIEPAAQSESKDSTISASNDSKQNDLALLDATDRLLALINFSEQVTLDCAENQRLLIERTPKLIQLCLQCIELPQEFLMRFTGCLSSESKGKPEKTDSLVQQRLSHLLSVLRAAACALLLSLTSSPSGRQALLNIVGPVPLLSALAACLASSLCPNQQNNNLRKSSTGKTLSPAAAAGYKVCELIGSATASLCAARAADILDRLIESPRFLTLARTSPEGLESLLSVIESALLVASPSPNSRLTATTTNCLASLLDSLASSCQDFNLQRNILQTRRPLLTALIECLSRHTPLLHDNNHAHLVRSTCRLLHNICVGHLDQVTNSIGPDEASTSQTNALGSFFASSPTLVNSLLSAIGAILDQQGHGPELRSVVVALAGRLLPICQSNQIVSWFGDSGELHVKEHNPVLCTSRLPERSRLLLAILDSCSLPLNEMTQPKDSSQTESSSTTAVTNDSTTEDSLSAQLLGGCIRCLAAGSNHSINLRYAIGDDKRRVRRLARLIRARLPASKQPPSSRPKSVCPAPPPLRDEVLAGNACLVLQLCAADTPLAEHLQGTSVILDLLALIQESQKRGTKRNAAILIGKLAHSSQVHRDELSRLDGWSVLTPFNSWGSALRDL